LTEAADIPLFKGLPGALLNISTGVEYFNTTHYEIDI